MSEVLKSSDVYYSLGKCWFCLCDVCTRVHCPKNMFYKASFSHCLKMMQREACPTIKCDFFEHKQKIRVFKVRRKVSRGASIINKLDEIIKKLDE